MTTRLNSFQSDWVEEKVKEGFEPSRAVNSVLLERSGVPPMPEQDQVIRLAQAELAGKKAAVDFMIGAEQGERSVFSYQTKLVVPSAQRVEIAKALIDGQPKTMGTSEFPQGDTWASELLEQHLASRPSRVVSPAWYWELGQGDQILERPQPGDESWLRLTERSGRWLRNLPAGMRGTDLSTLATRMAAGLRDGKPLDISFPTDPTDARRFEQWHFTVLDEEGELTDGVYPYVARGEFRPGSQYENLGEYRGDIIESRLARFRSSIDGPIEA